jgi:hypothetical protein
MAAKLGTALQQQHAAAAAGVLAGAASGVSAQLPPLSAGARLDIAAAVLGSGQHRRLIKSALHALVAGSSRCVPQQWACAWCSGACCKCANQVLACCLLLHCTTAGTAPLVYPTCMQHWLGCRVC